MHQIKCVLKRSPSLMYYSFYRVWLLWNFDTQDILSTDQLLSPLRIFERMLGRHQPMPKQHTGNSYLSKSRYS